MPEIVQALLVVEMGARACALRCDEVLEVLPRVDVTPVPDMPREVLGVINARGKVVPVLDPRRRFAAAAAEGEAEPPLPPFQYLVLVRTAKGPVAITVERVRDVVRVVAAEISYPGEKRSRPGVVRIGDELVVTLQAADFA